MLVYTLEGALRDGAGLGGVDGIDQTDAVVQGIYMDNDDYLREEADSKER
jgi:hypothetical protein